MSETPLVRGPDTPHGETLWPVSVKAVVRSGDRVLLAYNERDEWELLGGKLELDEEPRTAVAREVDEESGLSVEPGRLLDVWVYRIDDRRRVLIVTYDCPVDGVVEPTVSDEHRALGWWPWNEVADLPMPAGYVGSIELAYSLAGW
ncbi:MAG: NUDIX hydrolase [Acidimicrobiales bacterium]